MVQGGAPIQRGSTRTRFVLDLAFYAALLVGAVLRGAILQYRPMADAIFSDMQGYHDNAYRIANGIWFEGLFFQPVGLAATGAMLVKLGLKPIVMAYAHVVLGVFIIYFTGGIAERLGGQLTGVIAAWLIATSYPIIYLGSLFMAETMFGFFVLAASYVFMRWGALRAGAVILAALCLMISYWYKGMSQPAMAVMILFFAWFALRDRKRRWHWARALVIIMVATLALPLMHRQLTQKTVHKAMIGPAASGLNLVEGKCPWKRNEDNTGAGWWSPLYVQQGIENYKKWDHPFTDAAYYQKQGIECIKRDPVVLLRSFVNISELFVRNNLWPSIGEGKFHKVTRTMDGIFNGTVLPGLGLVLIPLFQMRKQARFRRLVVAIIAPIFGLFLTAYIFKAEIRYRVPFDPQFVALSAFGYVWFGKWLWLFIKKRKKAKAATSNTSEMVEATEA
jgi:4-amino-4-deoxy-L-arabinose transferase-like glycosyltransferase